MSAHEFACEHLIPGCTTRIEGGTQDEVARMAVEHLRTHHDANPVHGSDLNLAMWQAIVRLHG